MKYEVKHQQQVFEFYQDEILIFKVPQEEIAGFSSTFPWEIQFLKDIEVTERKDSFVITGLSKCGKVQVVLTLTVQEQDLAITAEYENISGEVIEKAVFQFGLPMGNVATENITLPHVLYNDNPSADKGRIVAHMGEEPGDGVIVEEHRLPIPGVNMEWNLGANYAVSLFSMPEPQDGRDEQYWSLGAVKTDGKTRLQALSGQTLFNGMKDMVYAGKNAPLPFERGYEVLHPGEKHTKQFYITMMKDFPTGQGFRDLTGQGYRLLDPKTTPTFATEKVVELKSNCLDSRYYKDENSSGYLTYGAANKFGNLSGRPEYYLYGWTGQALQLAWCDYVLGKRWGDRERQEKAMATVDFYAHGAESTRVSGLLSGYYLVEEQVWRGSNWQDDPSYSTRIQGEATYGLLDMMLLLREHQEAVPQIWEDTVRNALAFLMDESHQTKYGLYPLLWDLEGNPTDDEINSAGISGVVALAKGYRYFGEQTYLDYAKEMLQRYYQHQMADFSLPFCRATMDARCEDKEAGMYFFMAAYELYQITEDALYKEWAEISGDWILTFVYHWETKFLPESEMTKKDFLTTGWPGVSVQNHHLDVFFPCYEMYHFGKLTDNPRFTHLGKTVFQAFSHGICSYPGEWGFDVVGEQSEQFYQTNFFMDHYPKVLPWVKEWRKGLRLWNPSWIIQQVLKSGLCFLAEEEE